MSIEPRDFPSRIEFYARHVGPFEANAEAIGITPEEAAELEEKTEAARAALARRHEAMRLAAAATLELHDAVNLMSRVGRTLTRKIRARAQQVGNDSVYALAQIPPPANRAPLGPPGKPYLLSIALDAIGTLTLKWKCDNPAGAEGVMYQVWRKVGAHAGAGDFVHLGTPGKRMYVDDTVPAESTAIVYKIQAIRSTSVGPIAMFNVMFGSGASGKTSASVTEEKLAA